MRLSEGLPTNTDTASSDQLMGEDQPTARNPNNNVDDNNERNPNGEESRDILASMEDENSTNNVLTDDGPEYVTTDDAIEIQVDDDNIPMDDDEEENVEMTEGDMDDDDEDDDAVEMATLKVESHAGPVYAVSAFVHTQQEAAESGVEQPQPQISILTGGGDDKAFLHRVTVPTKSMETSSPNPTVVSDLTSVDSSQLEYAHTDSVSAVALNLAYLDTAVSKASENKTTSTNQRPASELPRFAAVGAYDGAIVIYHADTGALLQTLEGPTDVECLAFHPKGGTVLLAGSAADGTVWMYHIPLQKCLQVFVGHESAVTACQFSVDGRWALSASSDGTLRQWAPRSGYCKHVFQCGFDIATQDGGPPPGLTCLAVGGGADGQLVVVGAEDGRAHVCHVGTQKVVATLHHADEQTGRTGASAMQEDNGDDEEEEQEAVATSVEAVGFSKSHPHWCATGGVDGVLKIWDLTVGSANGSCRQVCHRRRRRQSTPQQQITESGAPSSETDTTAGVVDDDDVDNGGGITRLQWHPKWPLCFTSTTEGTVDLWDARNGQLLQSLTTASSSFTTKQDDSSNNKNNNKSRVLNDLDIQCTTDADDALIVTGGDDHCVRVFRVDVGALWNVSSTTGLVVPASTPAIR